MVADIGVVEMALIEMVAYAALLVGVTFVQVWKVVVESKGMVVVVEVGLVAEVVYLENRKQ